MNQYILSRMFYSIAVLATSILFFANSAIAQVTTTTARDPWRQPYTANSIWNTALGSTSAANALPITTNGVGALTADVTYLWYTNPDDPTVPVYLPPPYDYLTFVDVSLPDNFLSDQSYGFTPNNPTAILGPDFFTVELNPFKRTVSGSRIHAYNASPLGSNYLDFISAGLYGAHYGSGLSVAGGCLRNGELTGSEPIRHPLQIELPTYLLYKNLALNPLTDSDAIKKSTFVWPAHTSDSDISDYGVQNNYNPFLAMGSLLTIKPGVTAASLGITTVPGQKIFWTLQHYGGYIVDASSGSYFKPNGQDSFNIGIEQGAKNEFVATYGYEFYQGAGGGNAFFNDINAIYNNLAVITDNRDDNIGGSGTRLDTPIAPLAYGSPTTVNDGTQIEAEDYNIGGPNVGYYDTDNKQNGIDYSPDHYDMDGGRAYRDDGVDVRSTNDPDGGAPGNWAVGWTAAGEWLKYDINVATAGTYTITVRAASGASGGHLHFNDENGNNLTGAIYTFGTGSWDNFQTYTSGSFYLSSGNHTIQLVEDTAGYDLNYFTFHLAGGGSPNLVANPGFEADNGFTQNPSGWLEWSDTGSNDASFAEAGGGGFGGGSGAGTYNGSHWSRSSYRVYTFQVLTGLQNGTYTLSALMRSSGGQRAARIEAKNYDSTGNILMTTAQITSTWTRTTVPDIHVTNGQCYIGFWSDADAGQILQFDDVSFTKN